MAHVVIIGTKADLCKPHHITIEEAKVSRRRVRGGRERELGMK